MTNVLFCLFDEYINKLSIPEMDAALDINFSINISGSNELHFDTINTIDLVPIKLSIVIEKDGLPSYFVLNKNESNNSIEKITIASMPLVKKSLNTLFAYIENWAEMPISEFAFNNLHYFED